ncbi:hypothetical protein BMS3Abin17_00301 [archaeon BMS3Abin17]|nr:hypothetical protein BMS3Abin17_00301 [archaeon BMS3Abin17]HDZ60380.1 hypothetical protein [Candidatus Pacearchaeota archaeon]
MEVLSIHETISRLDSLVFTKKRDWYYVGGKLDISGIVTPREHGLWSLNDPFNFFSLSKHVEDITDEINYPHKLFFNRGQGNWYNSIYLPSINVREGENTLSLIVVPSYNVASGVEKDTPCRTCLNPMPLNKMRDYELHGKFLGKTRHKLAKIINP